MFNTQRRDFKYWFHVFRCLLCETYINTTSFLSPWSERLQTSDTFTCARLCTMSDFYLLLQMSGEESWQLPCYYFALHHLAQKLMRLFPFHSHFALRRPGLPCSVYIHHMNIMALCVVEPAPGGSVSVPCPSASALWTRPQQRSSS